MDLRQFIKHNIVRLDGGMGTLLQRQGLEAGQLPERWNITRADVIRDIHRAYFDAGSNIVCTNTFGANSLKFSDFELESIIAAAFDNLRAAAEQSREKQPKFAALDIGPVGRLLAPYGDLDFEDAVSIFSKTVKLGVKHGADLIFIETMNDSYETKAALLAAKESCDLPVFVSNAYGEDGKLMTGASPAAMTALLEGMGADMIGVNCSLGPDKLIPVVKEYLKYSSTPVLFKPNAGLPSVKDGVTVYDIQPPEFAALMKEALALGVRAVGGCCGTTPEHIAALSKLTRDMRPSDVEKKEITCVSSYTHAVEFKDEPVLIGERINPTGKKRFKQALVERDIDYILTEGLNQQERGAHVLDVNVGLPEIDEPELLTETVTRLQAVCDLPLQIDTSDTVAMERALRRCNGKAMINSVNGKAESMSAVFPLVKKYGGLVVALTLDENGIPDTASGRCEIARRILETAARYGISKKDIIFDPLAMTVSADNNAAAVTLGALRLIRENLGCRTLLGVSNVSFGLPDRDAVNSAFFISALENGLSAAIMNPYSYDMMRAYHTYRALHGMDENCAGYIAFSQNSKPAAKDIISPAPEPEAAEQTELRQAIVKGISESAAVITDRLLDKTPPLDIVQNEIIPALDKVGRGFESKKVYLPQLLMSAEAAKSAFERIKRFMAGKEDAAAGKCDFVIATVKGDIHDIGKNIVKLLLENYGFKVTDLGKDVPPEAVADAVCRLHAPLCGLSALMTTTVPAMEETIKLLRYRAPWCRIVVGGAVLNREYAQKIGADKYSADAMETVRYADKINSNLS